MLEITDEPSSGNNIVTELTLDSLWESITVKNGARLEMRGCTVSDAESAVSLEAGAEADIHSNTFRNNFTGILLNLQPGQNASLRNCYGNSFLAEGNLKPPRSGTKSFAGIWLNNANSTIGVVGRPPNTFDGLHNGVLAESSLLRLTNCTFRNLLKAPTVLSRYGSGRGVNFFRSSPAFSYLFIMGGEDKPVLFENCTVGVFAKSTNAYIFSTGMEDVDTGIRLQGCQSRALRLWKNDIRARGAGIALLQNNPRFCSVSGNHVEVEGSSSFPNPAGILVDDNAYGSPGYKNYLIRENTVEVSLTGTGIRMGTSSKVQVHDNTVLLQDEDGEKSGLRLSGTTDAWLRCNTVMGPAGAAYGVDSYGFDATSASGTLITCNNTSNTRLGFRFEGMGDAVQFRGNTIEDHFDGLMIEETGAIGLQEHHGNLWCGMYGGVGARHLSTFEPVITQSLFIVDADEIINSGCELLPSWEATAQWFIDQDVEPGTTFQCITDSGDACSTATPGPGEEPGEEDELLQKLVDGTFESPEFEDALKWTGQRHLYYRLLKKGEEELESWEEDFLDEYESTTVGEFSLVDSMLNTAFTLEEDTKEDLDSLHSRIESKLDSLHWVDWQYNFGIEVDTAALLAKHQSLLDSLSYLRQEGEGHIESIQLYREDLLDEVELSNGSISASEVFEVNEQDINALFLETIAIGIDTFTETQITALWAIANQCPLSGGDAVFKARSLYSLIDLLVKYEDEERCASEPEEKPAPPHQPEVVAKFQLIPNPTKDELSVRLPKPLGMAGYFMVYNLGGQVQLEKQLEVGETTFFINTSQLPAGIYYCTIRGHGINHVPQKLIIIR